MYVADACISGELLKGPDKHTKLYQLLQLYLPTTFFSDFGRPNSLDGGKPKMPRCSVELFQVQLVPDPQTSAIEQKWISTTRRQALIVAFSSYPSFISG